MRPAILTIVASIICTPSAAFTGSGRLSSLFGVSKQRPARSPSSLHDVAEGTATVAPTLPSWDELSSAVDAATPEEPPKPLVTLYRDTNGWCPFCERVWLVLRAKGIPYDEQLISLQNKPEWYKALVPTTLVPAVLFHGDGETNERRIVWESSDIIRALEEDFPETPKMVQDTPEYEDAVKMNGDLSTAGVGFVYAGRNESLSEEDKLDRKKKFLSELDGLDAALATQQKSGDGGSFRLGAFSAVDALMIPTLERWRVQLPLTSGVDIQEGRPALVRWFEAMDSYEPYASRVAGDEYSWTAANSMFLRYFGGGEEKPEVAEAIRRADEAAECLAASFADVAVYEDGDKRHSLEAASKLVANHEAVVQDCTRDDPISQQQIGRASNSDTADAVLRYVASCLLSDNGTLQQAGEAPLPSDIEEGSAKDAATAARTVASRLCVPRDMSAPAAGVLRAALSTVADRLEE